LRCIVVPIKAARMDSRPHPSVIKTARRSPYGSPEAVFELRERKPGR
jgi:hypothetical protein